MFEIYEEELSRARAALESGNVEACFGHLERAHVLSQRMTGRHIHVPSGNVAHRARRPSGIRPS